MRVTMLSNHDKSCLCPTCGSFTVAMPQTKSADYCPTCLTVITHLPSVKLVQPRALKTAVALA
jgi:uncharacterized paraquat-inducible protein A